MSDDKLDAAQTLHPLAGDDAHGVGMAHDDETDSLEEDQGVPEEAIHHEDPSLEAQPDATELTENHSVEAAEGEAAAPPAVQLGPEKHWYIIHAYSGFLSRK